MGPEALGSSSELKGSDIVSAPIARALAALGVDPDRGLTQEQAGPRLGEYGYNEVVERREHPVIAFLGKFWGLLAWMLELIMLLSLVLGSIRISR
jgi:H+-transporting ATPase